MRHVWLRAIAVLDATLVRDDPLLLFDDALGLEVRLSEVLGLWLVFHGPSWRRARATSKRARDLRRFSAMKNNKTPHNQDGQQPTRSAKETEERLEEKEHEEHGQANKDRIEAKISTLKD
jgi:hypothetical protein